MMPPDPQDGPTATNPQTGERVVLRGGQWVPLGAPEQTAPGTGFTVRPLGTGTRQPAPQTDVQRRKDEAELRGAELRNQKLESDIQATDGTPVPVPGDTRVNGEDYLKTVDPNLATQVKALADGRLAIPSGQALRTPYWQKMLQMTAQYDPTFDAANAATRRKTRLEFTSGQAARNITSFNTALGHLETLSRAADDLGNMGWQAGNSIKNWVRTQFGAPEVVSFNTAKQAVVSELERAFRGTAGTLSGIKEWEASINDAESPEQLHAAISKAGELLASRVQALGEQYDAGMGKSSDPINLLDPHAQQVMASLVPGWTAPPRAPRKPNERLDASAPLPPGDRDDPGTPTITTAPVPFSTPRDKKMATVLQTLMNRGASAQEASRKQVEFGYPPMGDSEVKEWNRVLQYNRTRPKNSRPGRVGVPQSGRRELTPAQKSAADDAASPVGAVFTGAANGILPGLADEAFARVNSTVTGKPYDEALAEMDLRKNLIRGANPTAFTAGEIGGAALDQVAGGGLAGAGLKGAARTFAPRALAGDAAYGAVYGAGENNQDRVSGGVLGALTGMVGGSAGRAATKGLASVIAPRVAPAVRFLRDRGVRTTLGQSLGPNAAAVEAGASYLPLVGTPIRAAIERSEKDFNRAVINEALKPIGETLPKGSSGTSAMAAAQRLFDKAYADARAGMSLTPDTQMISELTELEGRVLDGGLDDAATARLRKIYDAQVGRRLQRGTVSGDEYKSMGTALDRLRDGMKLSNPELAQAIGDLQGIVDRAARRSSPPEAAAAMDAADQGYALYVRAENAAKARGGETGTFSPRQLDAAVQKGDSSTRSRAYLRGDALGQDLSEAGVDVLRYTGHRQTPGEAIIGAGGLGYLGSMSPASLGALGGVAGAYAPGVRDVLSGLAARKSARGAQALADFLRGKARFAGMGASTYALEQSQPR